MSRVTLPAVPISTLWLPPRISPGEKVISEDPGVAPDVLASQMPASAIMARACCAARPGLDRPCRILVMRTGFPVTAERATAVRTIWPPPSPNEPSISIINRILHLSNPSLRYQLMKVCEGYYAEGLMPETFTLDMQPSTFLISSADPSRLFRIA